MLPPAYPVVHGCVGQMREGNERGGRFSPEEYARADRGSPIASAERLSVLARHSGGGGPRRPSGGCGSYRTLPANPPIMCLRGLPAVASSGPFGFPPYLPVVL
jgi:hypothetical protein